jgi:hypothetical protein
MTNLAAAFAAVAALVAATGAHALTIHTSPFLLSPGLQIGFEAATSATSYVENGIEVSYVGTISSGGIWTTSQAAEGKQSWYANGGGFGYTRLQFGKDVTAFQFAAGSGWPQAKGQSADPHLQFRLLLDGAVLADGRVGGVRLFSGFTPFGFSGLTFDEVHLQSLNGDVAFDTGGFDALALDALAFAGPIGGVIPEPATWAMMILGFGLVGTRLRRHQALPA